MPGPQGHHARRRPQVGLHAGQASGLTAPRSWFERDRVRPVPNPLPPFRPAFGLAGPHTQTIMGRLLRRAPAVAVVRERWDTPDGDFVEVDLTPDLAKTDRPIVVIFHGLEGSSRRTYVRLLMEALLARGIECVGFNFRGCGGQPNRLPRAYHSGDSAEADWVAGHLTARWPNRPLGAAGFSLGGNLLLKHLGEAGRTSRFAAAAVASVPYDLAEAERAISGRGVQRVYAHYFLRSLKRKVAAKRALLGEELVREALAARSLGAFDDAVTAPLHGFRDASDYYRRCSSTGFLDGVVVPTLAVHALDDPFLPAPSIPVAAFERNAHLYPMVTKRGGHQGYLGGSPWAPVWWAEEVLAAFLTDRLRRGY